MSNGAPSAELLLVVRPQKLASDHSRALQRGSSCVSARIALCISKPEFKKKIWRSTLCSDGILPSGLNGIILVLRFLSPPVIGRKVTLYPQPQNRIIWSRRRSSARTKSAASAPPAQASSVSPRVCLPTRNRQPGKPGPASDLRANRKMSAPLPRVLKTGQDWHRDPELVLFGSGLSRQLEPGLRRIPPPPPAVVSHALGIGRLFQFSHLPAVHWRDVADKGRRHHPLQSLPPTPPPASCSWLGGDDDKRSEWWDLTGGVLADAAENKHLLNEQLGNITADFFFGSSRRDQEVGRPRRAFRGRVTCNRQGSMTFSWKSPRQTHSGRNSVVILSQLLFTKTKSGQLDSSAVTSTMPRVWVALITFTNHPLTTMCCFFVG